MQTQVYIPFRSLKTVHRSVPIATLLLFMHCPLAAEEPATETVAMLQKSLFDGKTLGQWEIVRKGDFQQHGKVEVQDGCIVIGAGMPGSGVRWAGEFPKMGYEISLEGKRVQGDDFFCGLTFPVGDSALTLILGGWSGWVVGLSCIDGKYAIDNETCQGVEFEQDRWYRVRVRVTKPRIEVWLDDKQIVDLQTADHTFAASNEMEPCLPMGLATWHTTGALRHIRYRICESPVGQ
jgi:hypothetical protein